MTRQFWICAVITLVSSCVSAGFAIAGLLSESVMDGFAQYAASRSVALLLSVSIAVVLRSAMGVILLGIAMTAVQFFDGIIGVLAHDPFKAYGPLAFSIVNALAAWRLLRSRGTNPTQ
jgi:hypothetical protein